MASRLRGFTLIELMIVVAIIGILAAIAIPNFMKYQLRSKRSEGSINVTGIKVAEIAYHANHDVFVTAAIQPRGSPDNKKHEWCTVSACDYFDTLAWRPEGAVYFTYQVPSANAGQFNLQALGDVDGDTEQSCWAYTKSNNAGSCLAIPAAACAPSTVVCDQLLMNAGIAARPDDVY